MEVGVLQVNCCKLIERTDAECAGPRLVVTHRLSWVRWNRGCRTLISSRLEGPALLRPSPAGPWLLHARQGHPCLTLWWTECPWTWEDAGWTESRSWVWWSSRASEKAWGDLARPPETEKAGPGESPTYPRWGSEVENRGLTRKAVHPEVGSDGVVRHSPGSMTGQGVREKALRPRTGPCCPLAKGEGDGSVETGSRALPSSPYWDPEEKETALFEVLGTTGNRTKRKQKILHPALPRGKEWCGHHLLKSRIQRLRVARLRNAACLCPCQAREAPGQAAPLSYGQLQAAAVVKAAAVAELERRWSRLPKWLRRADGGAAVGGRVERAADRRGRMWRNASVCFCAAENCWAKSSTASPNRPAWEIRESRKRCLSDSLISAKVNHR